MNDKTAKEIRAMLPPSIASLNDPLRLRVEPADDLSRLVAERVAVNARQGGLIVQVQSRGGGRTAPGAAAQPEPALRLVRWHLGSLAPGAALDALVAGLGLRDPSSTRGGADAEQLYERERGLVDAGYVIPLVYLPESVGLGANVRNWMPSRWGEWRLAEVWLDQPGSAPKSRSSGAAPAANGETPGAPQ